MSFAPASSIARRDLLRGTAALLGGSALGLLPTLAEAALPASPSLGFWNGSRFVSAESLLKGDAGLDRVRITVTGTRGVEAIEAHAPSAGTRYPFTLWVPPPGGMVRSRASLATEPNGDLVLAAFVDGERHEFRLAVGRRAGPKLREGIYLLTPGKGAWSAFGLDQDGKAIDRGAAFPHVLLTVERV